MQSVCNFYDNYSENDRLLQRRSRKLEYITTMKYLNETIKENSVIADIGAGTGVYTFDIAKKAKQVVAIDLVPSHVEVINNRIINENISNITALVGSALNINIIKNESVDFLLCLGPLYHLQNEADRLLCFTECRRVLKKNGIAFFGYINRVLAMQYYVKNKKYFNNDLNQKLNKSTYTNISGFDPFLDISFLTDPEMIEKEAVLSCFNPIKNIGVDSVSYFIQDQLEEMSDEQWQDYIKFHFENCERKSSFGMSTHGLLICQKE